MSGGFSSPISRVSLLARASELDSQSFSLAGGGSLNGGNGDIYTGLTGIGYELRLTTGTLAAGTNPFGKLTLIWTESISGLVVAQENWYFGQGQAASKTVLRGTGPTKGDTLQIIITNLDTVSVYYTYVIVQNSRVYSRDNIYQIGNASYLPTPAFNAPDSIEMEALIVATRSHSLATGVADQVLLPLYSGKAHLSGTTGSNGSDGEFQLSYSAADPSASTGIIIDAYTNSQGHLDTDITIPRASCLLIMTNHNASTKTLKYTLTALEY
jgi:hypothetical protein